MEAVLASAGAILVLLSFGGVAFESQVLKTTEPVPPGDRVAAALVGWALIVAAMLVEVGKLSEPVLWVALATGTAAIAGYSLFLFMTRPRGEAARDSSSGTNR